MKNRMKALIVGLLLLMVVGVAAAASVPGTTIVNSDGTAFKNPTCENGGYTSVDFKIGDSTLPFPVTSNIEQTYYIDDAHNFWIKITLRDVLPGDDGKNSLDWSSNFDVDAVVVKGGNAGNLYVYEGTQFTRGDTDLRAPLKNDQYPTLSHLDFCFETPVPEFPTLALPVGMIVGIVGLVYVVKKRED